MQQLQHTPLGGVACCKASCVAVCNYLQKLSVEGKQ
jgi:hypothetical protein